MQGMTILIPHKSTAINDIALELNIRTLKENTKNQNYDLQIMREKREPYSLWNEYAQKAKFEHIVFSNSDVIMAPNWDVNFQRWVNNNNIITGYLVEPGAIGVASQNIHKNFGKHPGTFRRHEFEEFCAQHDAPEFKEERGWYMPCIMTKTMFLKMGMFPTDQAFPHPNDILFWNHCTKNGIGLGRARSFAYHFQYLSDAAQEYKRV